MTDRYQSARRILTHPNLKEWTDDRIRSRRLDQRLQAGFNHLFGGTYEDVVKPAPGPEEEDE